MVDNNRTVFFDSLQQYTLKIQPLRNQPLAPKTSVKVGGPADYIISICDTNELINLFQNLIKYRIPWFVLGKGTNLLIRDEGFPGAVVILKGVFKEIRKVGGNKILCGAGASSKKLAGFARKNGLKGAEFLATIPGTIGGAVYMNAGAYGQQMNEIIDWVEFLDDKGRIKIFSEKEVGFSYRSSIFKETLGVILRTSLILKTDSPDRIADREKEMIQHRKKTQPIDKRTWGSVFLNPAKQSAGELIEAAGLKGKGFGKARISPKHANFIENTGNASFDDLMNTIELARDTVLRKYDIKLKMEGIIIPDFFSKRPL